MLKPRLITALILIPLVILAIFFLPPMGFLSVALLIMLLAGWEWSALSGYESYLGRIFYLLILALALVGSLFVPILLVICVAVLWWLCATILLVIHPKHSGIWGNHRWVIGAMGFLVLIPCWIGLIILQGYSPLVLMFCLALIWIVDSTAYFVGKKWGQRKIAPAISPGKSYEGVLAGMVASIVIAILGLWILDVSDTGTLVFILICFFGGGVLSVLGDFFESMMKRRANTKDSSGLLPGHGGVLDRIDSMTTAIPFFALVIPYFFSS
jgi:phosphatidate cytidylyltransferase